MEGNKGVEESLRMEIDEGLHRGIEMMFDGVCLKEEMVDSALILMEENDYMRDFVFDDKGKVVKIHYDRI